MHRYTLDIDGRPFVVDVQDLAADRYRVTVDGQGFEVVLQAREEQSGDGAAALAAAPRIVPVGPARSSTPAALARGASPARAPAPAAQDGGDVLRAPMPGAILRISVAVGAQVQRGQDIAVLEAMKMENVIRAPRAGTIAEVCVQPGQQLAHGEPIVKYARAEEVPG